MRWAARLTLAAALIAAAALWMDAPAYAWAKSLSPFWKDLAQRTTDVGQTGWILLLMAATAALLIRKARPLPDGRRFAAYVEAVRWTAFFITATALVSLASSLTKNSLGRARPLLHETEGFWSLSPFAFNPRWASFPSGHTTTLFAAAAALALAFPGARWPLFTFAALGSLTRVVIGAHYASDVVAGALLGVFGTWALYEAARKRGWLATAGSRPALRARAAMRAAFGGRTGRGWG